LPTNDRSSMGFGGEQNLRGLRAISTSFSSRPKSVHGNHGWNNSIYECIGVRPLASTAFPVGQNEPERLVAGISVASAVSLSRGAYDDTAFANPLYDLKQHVNCHKPPPQTTTTTHFSAAQSNPYINYPATTERYPSFQNSSTLFSTGPPPTCSNDEGMLV